MFNKIILFSHNDLDGYACNVVVRTYAELLRKLGVVIPVIENNCDYSTIDTVIESTLETLELEELQNSLFIVSDISWKSPKLTNYLKNMNYFVFADHHKSSESLALEIEEVTGRRIAFCKEGAWCGACRLLECLDQLLSDNGYTFGKLEDPYCYENCGVLGRLGSFLNLVNEWDLWLWANDPKIANQRSAYNLLNQPSPKLNEFLSFCTDTENPSFVDMILDLVLKGISFGTDLNRLYEDFNTFTHDWMSRSATVLEIYSRQYRRIALKMPDGKKDVDTLCFTCPYGYKNKSLLSMLAHIRTRDLSRRDFDCLMVYENGSKSISLRYPEGNLDLSEVAKQNKLASGPMGGGHLKQAGFPVDTYTMTEILDRKKIYTL